MKNLHIYISGKVQKVGYRYFVKQQAIRTGITGTVCYMDKQTLTIEASGTEKALDEFISYCRIGTLGSRIDNINITESPITIFRSFEILHEEKHNPNNHLMINNN